jgi:hypothetical protein
MFLLKGDITDKGFFREAWFVSCFVSFCGEVYVLGAGTGKFFTLRFF